MTSHEHRWLVVKRLIGPCRMCMDCGYYQVGRRLTFTEALNYTAAGVQSYSFFNRGASA